MEGANFLGDIASLETGKSPVDLKPEMKCSGFKDLSQRSLMRPIIMDIHSSHSVGMYTGSSSFVTVVASVSNRCSFKITFHVFFTGPYTPTSIGCIICVTCGGRQKRWTPLLFASWISCRVKWEWCPSTYSTTGPLVSR